MSRHHVRARHPNYRVVAGWDPPLASYFAIVYDTTRPSRDSDYGKIVYWLGTQFAELDDLNTLAAQLYHYAEIPAEIAAVLRIDRELGR